MKTGILDKSKLTTNFLLILLVGLNIFFGIQYTQSIQRDSQKIVAESAKTEDRIKTSKFMKLFIDKVLSTNGTISFEDRVKLESDIRGLGDESLVKQWEVFVASKDGDTAQKSAVLLMSMLMNKMII